MKSSRPPSTVPMDLPPALASLLSAGGSTPAPGAPASSMAGLSGAMSPASQSFIPSYQAGGLVAQGGAPVPTGGGMAMPGQMPSGGISPQMLDMGVNQFATQNPEQVMQIQQAIQQAMASGELTPQELNMMVQLATVAAQNPEMYPNVRRFAIQQGIATEQDLPQQYDQGLIAVILIAAKAMQNGGAATPPAGGVLPSMAVGGTVPPSKKDDGSVLINAHENEYVIPAEIVKRKGTDFFDKMIGKDVSA